VGARARRRAAARDRRPAEALVAAADARPPARRRLVLPAATATTGEGAPPNGPFRSERCPVGHPLGAGPDRPRAVLDRPPAGARRSPPAGGSRGAPPPHAEPDA